jgi:hypothetical protein
MKALKTWMGRPWPPLALALLTALAVHLLALAYGQLATSRQAAGGQRSPVPPPHDDTPELLEFSRQQPLEETLATVPLPPPSTLPAATRPGRSNGRRATRADPPCHLSPPNRYGPPWSPPRTRRRPWRYYWSRPGAARWRTR